MVRTDGWKYVEWLCAPPQLFDLDADPEEYRDLGRDPGYGKDPGGDARPPARLDPCTGGFAPSSPTRPVARRTGKAQERGFRFGEW